MVVEDEDFHSSFNHFEVIDLPPVRPVGEVPRAGRAQDPSTASLNTADGIGREPTMRDSMQSAT